MRDKLDFCDMVHARGLVSMLLLLDFGRDRFTFVAMMLCDYPHSHVVVMVTQSLWLILPRRRPKRACIVGSSTYRR